MTVLKALHWPLQAVFSEVRRNELRSPQGPTSKKWALSLDRSAVDKARQLSRLLDEAPQQGGCPFMVPTDVKPEPSKARSCPFSSGRAPTALEDLVPAAEASVCPFGATNLASVMPAPDRAAPGCYVSGCLQADESSWLHQPKAAAKCPLHSGGGSSSPVASLPHIAPDLAAAQTEHEQPQIGAMTEEELKEYEQAFAVEPNEAMLQAYAALLADRIAGADRDSDDAPQRDSGRIGEADREPDSTRQHDDDKIAEADREPEDTQCCNSPGHRPEEPTQPAHIQPPSHTSSHTKANAVPQAECSGQCHETEDSRVHQSSQQISSAQETEASSASAAAAAVATAAAASPSDRMTTRSLWLRAATAHAKAATKAFRFQGLHRAHQQSMRRVRSCCDYLRQQPLRWHVLMTVCFGVQLAMTLYFSLVHQRYAFLTNMAASLQPFLYMLSQHMQYFDFDICVFSFTSYAHLFALTMYSS